MITRARCEPALGMYSASALWAGAAMASKALNAANLKPRGDTRLAQLLIEMSDGNAPAKQRLRLELVGADKCLDPRPKGILSVRQAARIGSGAMLRTPTRSGNRFRHDA